jgi:TldD protein
MSVLRGAKGMGDRLEGALQRPQFRDYELVELREERTVQTTIEIRDDEVEGLSQVLQVGNSARVIVNGAWGFASLDGSGPPARSIELAGRMARGVSGKTSGDGIRLASVRPVRRRLLVRTKEPLEKVDLGDKILYLKSVTKRVKSSDDRITTCGATYTEVTGRKRLLTSEGTDIESDVALVHLRTTAVGRSGSALASARDEYGLVSSGWDRIQGSQSPEVVSSRLSSKIRNQMDGIRCRRGSFPCLLGPRAVGMLAHEALGHLSEADLFGQGAFVGREGQQVAPSFVTMIDAPRLRGGFGNIEVDDEGVVPRPVTIIDNGVLKDQMTNREWAKRIDRKPTGNARSEGYRYPPIIRMRNTYFARGDRDLEELMEAVGNGYYCGDVRGGQAESNSSFQMGIQECFEIRRGELGRPVKYMAISGIATKSLGLISGVGSDFGFESSYCGKDEQYMQTSDGGPHLTLKKGAIVFGGG